MLLKKMKQESTTEKEITHNNNNYNNKNTQSQNYYSFKTKFLTQDWIQVLILLNFHLYFYRFSDYYFILKILQKILKIVLIKTFKINKNIL